MKYRAFFDPQEPACYSALIALGASLTLGIAWFFQYFLGYTPCALCYLQRWPYYVGIPFAIAATGLIQPRGYLRLYAASVLTALGAIFLIGMVMGVHHSGVEWGWWEGPAACSPGAASGSSVADLFGEKAPRFVSCSAASWRFLGLSFAGWNAVITCVLVCIAVAGIVRIKRRVMAKA